MFLFAHHRAEEEFLVRGPIRTAQLAAGSSANENEDIRTGGQILRQLIAQLLRLTMDERELALDHAITVPPAPTSTVVPPCAVADSRADARTGAPRVDTLEVIFDLLKEIIPSDLHAKCAHILVQSTAFARTGSAKECDIVALARKFSGNGDRDER